MRVRPWVAVIGRLDDRLADWLRAGGLDAHRFWDPHEAQIAKNTALAAFLSSGERSLLMLDGDQIPTDDTRILDADDLPLAYCGYASRTVHGWGHFGDGDFGAGCFRARRSTILAMQEQIERLNTALRAVPLPIGQPLEVGWFYRALSKSGTLESRCPCEWFHALAQVTGVRAVMVGTIGHAGPDGSVLVLDDTHTSFSKWPHA